MLTSLLELCGFEAGEMQRELPRAQRAFDMLGLTLDDFEHAEQRIKEFYDTELEGVRKALRIHMRELFDLMLAREEKEVVIHATIPTLAADILTAVALHSDRVHVSFPELICQTIMGAFFNKFDHVLDAAEKLWLKEAGAHCSLIETRLGLYSLNLIPKPDLFISLGRTCDDVPKSDELLQEFYGIPVVYINAWQDQWDPERDFPRGCDTLAQQLDRCQKRIEQVVGFEVKKEVLAESAELREELMATMNQCRDLMLRADPPPLDLASWQLFRRPAGRPQTRYNLQAVTEAIRLLQGELEQRVRQGRGVVPKGAPRVMIAVASYVDPGFTRLLEGMGLAASLEETSISGPYGEFGCRVETEGKTFNQIGAEKVLWKSNTAILPVRISAIIQACKRYNIDGVLWNYLFSCRATFGDSMILKNEVGKELGIPVMAVEYDIFDPRFHITPQLASQVEIFAEMVKLAKAAKEGQA